MRRRRGRRATGARPRGALLRHRRRRKECGGRRRARPRPPTPTVQSTECRDRCNRSAERRAVEHRRERVDNGAARVQTCGLADCVGRRRICLASGRPAGRRSAAAAADRGRAVNRARRAPAPARASRAAHALAAPRGADGPMRSRPAIRAAGQRRLAPERSATTYGARGSARDRRARAVHVTRAARAWRRPRRGYLARRAPSACRPRVDTGRVRMKRPCRHADVDELEPTWRRVLHIGRRLRLANISAMRRRARRRSIRHAMPRTRVDPVDADS